MTTMTTAKARRLTDATGLTPELARYLDASTDAYRAGLMRALVREDGTAEGLPAPEEVAEYGTQVLPVRTSPLGASVGPVYTTASVMKVLGVSRQQIDDRRRRGTILALRTADGTWVYPAFQFDSGAVRPAVRAVLDVFRAVDPDWWTVAAWLRHPRAPWDGRSAAELLAEGVESLDVVLPAAHEAAARWAA